MIIIRHAADRGFTENDWLKSRHTFSFGEYYDPTQMGFGPLRVINEDQVKPEKGFSTHRHKEMEIISYVISGGLSHQDSLGTGSLIQPGEIQRMSAGIGITHSEFNPSLTEPVHFLQIWITPQQPGLTPSYEQKKLPVVKNNELILIGSPQGTANGITIHQQIELYLGHLNKEGTIQYDFQNLRNGWLQLITGNLILEHHLLNPGDGVKLSQAGTITLKGLNQAEFLLFVF